MGYPFASSVDDQTHHRPVDQGCMKPTSNDPRLVNSPKEVPRRRLGGIAHSSQDHRAASYNAVGESTRLFDLDAMSKWRGHLHSRCPTCDPLAHAPRIERERARVSCPCQVKVRAALARVSPALGGGRSLRSHADGESAATFRTTAAVMGFLPLQREGFTTTAWFFARCCRVGRALATISSWRNLEP